jgi:hypothetical protein
MKTASFRRWGTSLLICWLIAALLVSLYNITAGIEPVMGWIGALLACVAPLSWFGLVLLRGKRQNMPQPLGFTAVSGLGLAISMSNSWRYGPTADPTHLAAGISLIGWFVYLRWIRTSPTRPARPGAST